MGEMFFAFDFHPAQRVPVKVLAGPPRSPRREPGALSLVLLIAAGLFLTSFARLQKVERGSSRQASSRHNSFCRRSATTSEIGIRMALGASPGMVLRMVLGHGRRLTLLGIALGMVGAFLVSRLMQQALFEVDAADPLVYLVVAAKLLLVAECASWLPARRATRIDPEIALRNE